MNWWRESVARRIGLAGFLLLGPLAIGRQELTGQDRPAQEPTTRESRVQELRQSLAVSAEPYVRVMVFTGSVAVRGWEVDSILVTGSVEGDARFYLGGSGNSAKLGVWPERRSEAPFGELEVRVPRGSTVWVKTESAPVRVEGVDGAVDVYSVTGEVRIAGSPRSVRTESMGGQIEIDVTASSVGAKTAAGAVILRGRVREATVTTVAGRIDVVGLPLDRGRFETVTGDLHFAAGVRPGGSLDFRTHSGDVSLALPPGTGADFLVRTVEGRVVNSLPVADDRSSPPAFRGREVSFLAGDGGASIAIQTYSGEVRLESREGLPSPDRPPDPR